jgi:hypothetical protein
MYHFPIYILLFSSFSLCSDVIRSDCPIFDKISLDQSFINLIDRCKENSSINVPNDPKTFREDTLQLIFNTLVKIVSIFRKSPLLSGYRDSFDSLVVRNFYSLIKEFHKSDPERFIQFLIKADVLFKMFIHAIEVEEVTNIFFTDLVGYLECSLKNNNSPSFLFKKSTFFFHGFSSQFAVESINSLLEKPLVSPKEWTERKKTIEFYLLLEDHTDSLYDHTLYSPIKLKSGQYGKLIDEFSIINENEINFTRFQFIYSFIDLQRSNSTGIFKMMIFLFSLFSTHFYKSPFTQIKNPAEIHIRLLCWSIIFKERRNFNRIHQILTESLEKLVAEAIKIIELEVEEKLKLILGDRFFKTEGSQKNLKEKIKRFLEGFVNGDFDHLSFSIHLNKWMIKVYLHILKFDAALKFLGSFFINCIDYSIERQATLSILGNNPDNHLFVQLIGGLKKITVPLELVPDQDDPVVFGNNTIVSIFHNLMDAIEFLPEFLLTNDDEKVFNDLVEEFYYPLQEQFYNLFPIKFLQFTIKSEIGFQILIFREFGAGGPSFTKIVDYIKHVKKAMNMEKKFDPDEEIYLVKAAIQYTRDKIMDLLRLPLISAEDWEMRKAIIKLHLVLLSKAGFVLTDNEVFGYLNTNISMKIKEFEYLIDNFSIVNENQVDFQKFLELYKNILDNLYIDDKRIALFSLYAHHLLGSLPSKIDGLNVPIKFIGICFILKDECSFMKAHRMFCLDPKKLILKALRRIRYDIYQKLTKTFPFYSRINEHFHGRNLPLQISKSTIRILRNYAEGTMRRMNWGVSQGLIKLYLHLLHYHETVKSVNP